MKLNLMRPLVFFDLETTGVNVGSDRIVEISLVKLCPDGHKESMTYRVNPEMHIPEGATAVHHITDDDVRDCPTFRELAPKVLGYIRNCDLAGYNSNHFDIPMLQEELMRAGVEYDLKQESRFVDAFVIFQKHTPRTLTAAYKHYCNRDLEGAHGANADTEATYEVLMAQLEQHDDVPKDVAALAEYTTQQRWADLAGKLGLDEQNRPTVNFGKYKGQALEDIFRNDPGYYSWLMQGDFPLYTKRICEQVMNALKAERKAERQANRKPKFDEEPPKPATDEQLQELVSKFGKGAQLQLF